MSFILSLMDANYPACILSSISFRASLNSALTMSMESLLGVQEARESVSSRSCAESASFTVKSLSMSSLFYNGSFCSVRSDDCFFSRFVPLNKLISISSVTLFWSSRLLPCSDFSGALFLSSSLLPSSF